MNRYDLPIPVAKNDLLRLFRWHQLDFPASEPNCEFVGAGSYSISKTANGYLTTAPGAGVGVALYDRFAGIGGVANFLLAEPFAGRTKRRDDYYVASALPEFIAALVAAGAHPDRLVATVAGGSCLVNRQDELDEVALGTQTADLALSILRQEKIRVAALEVGGVQPLSLLLDTESWQASVKLVAADDNLSAADVVKPSLAEIEQAIDDVKPIPQIALKIIRMLGSGKQPSFSQLAAEINRDQVVAAKILRYSNSAMFSHARPIDSIERALLLLGERNLLEIAVSTAAGMIYSGREGGYSLMRGGLYRHALATALTAKELAIFSGFDPGVAYTAGLVHDIGKVVLDRFVADALPFFYRQQVAETDFVDLERDLFAIDHAEIGQRLADRWQLPDSLAQAIGFHHSPQRGSEEHRLLVHLVYIADLLASAYLSGMEMERINAGDLAERLEFVGLRQNQLPLIIDKIPWKNLLYM